jgi:hypothetical protein
MLPIDIKEIAEVLERARTAALPGREACERDAILCALHQLLAPVKPPPRWLVNRKTG